MRYLFFFVSVVLSFSTTAMATVFPPGLDEAKWGALVEKIVREGKASPMDEGFELRSLERYLPDAGSIPYTAEFASTLGAYDNSNQYYPLEISVVSESWNKDSAGNWLINQRAWRFTLFGQMTYISHSLIVETQERQILDIKNYPTGGFEEPEELAIVSKVLLPWVPALPVK